MFEMQIVIIIPVIMTAASIFNKKPNCR